MVIDARGNTIKETRDNIATIMKAHGYPAIPIKCEKCGAEGYVFRDDILDKDGYRESPCETCGGRIKRV